MTSSLLLDQEIKKKRWYFVDLFRFAAVILMIQGHAFQALLNTTYSASAWFPFHSFWHGFTAPMFMFASGIAFGIATLRSWSQHKLYSETVKKRLVRYASLIAIGYFLHLPYFSFSKILRTADQNLLSRLLSFDALHLIGISLLVLQLFVLVLKKKSTVMYSSALLALLTLVLAPQIWEYLDAASNSIFLRSVLSNSADSLFPMAPWMVYVFVGFFCAYFLQADKNSLPSYEKMTRLLWIGMMMIIGSGLISFVDSSTLKISHGLHWNVNPLVVVFKSGGLLCFLVLLYVLCLPIQFSARSKNKWNWVSVIQTSANQTLAIYVLHLVILYGSPINLGVRYFLGSKVHSLLFTSVLTIILIVLMLIFAVFWDFSRRSEKIPDRKLKAAFTLILVFAFLTRSF